MIEEKRNFLIVELCDNDFSNAMRHALEELTTYWTDNIQNYCPFAIKEYMIASMTAYMEKSYILRDRGTFDREQYVKWFKGMRVTFRQKMPTYDIEGTMEKDDDGGSVGYDINTKQIFQF